MSKRADAHREALDALARALDQLRAARRPWPCQYRLDDFHADDHETRAEAAKACAWCPIKTECDAVGKYEHWGIWGGKDRERIPPRRAGQVAA